jgi:NAD(P)-dependent dehydrogenase (short-subunit alcohol dehydrogenase family)
MGRLEGRVIIVTGGSRGIGAAMSRLFAEEGARVVIADIRDDLGEGLVASMQNAGGDVEYRHLDVSRPGEWQLVVADLEARHGRLDGSVNNAGVLGGGPILEHTMDAWEHVIAVNQTARSWG